jgi:hypothetical protein
LKRRPRTPLAAQIIVADLGLRPSWLPQPIEEHLMVLAQTRTQKGPHERPHPDHRRRLLSGARRARCDVKIRALVEGRDLYKGRAAPRVA